MELSLTKDPQPLFRKDPTGTTQTIQEDPSSPTVPGSGSYPPPDYPDIATAIFGIGTVPTESEAGVQTSSSPVMNINTYDAPTATFGATTGNFTMTGETMRSDGTNESSGGGGYACGAGYSGYSGGGGFSSEIGRA